MKILVTGSRGLVGASLVPFLRQAGHEVIQLVRFRTDDPNTLYWNPKRGILEPKDLEGFDAVIHLAGEGIASGRWTEEKKAAIENSRVQGTTLLANTLAELTQPPKVLITASAIGYYGDRGDEVLTETSQPAKGFLPKVCGKWEATTNTARDKGIRVVNLRFGIILSKKGGALAMMLPPFLLGGGGKLGSGKQYMSWVVLDDVIRVIDHALVTDNLRGPVNVTAPNPVTNAEFTQALGGALMRPTLFPVPALAVKALFGEMGNALLLSSSRVKPVRLEETGFKFAYPKIEEGLKAALKG